MEQITMVHSDGREFITDNPAEIVQFRNQGFREKDKPTQQGPQRQRAAKTASSTTPPESGASQ